MISVQVSKSSVWSPHTSPGLPYQLSPSLRPPHAYPGLPCPISLSSLWSSSHPGPATCFQVPWTPLSESALSSESVTARVPGPCPIPGLFPLRVFINVRVSWTPLSRPDHFLSFLSLVITRVPCQWTPLVPLSLTVNGSLLESSLPSQVWLPTRSSSLDSLVCSGDCPFAICHSLSPSDLTFRAVPWRTHPSHDAACGSH